MAIKYCDWANGNDATGDGSAENPYKTIDKASTGLTGGDEWRCAKGPAPIALDGTLTWTDGSTSVATSQDLTGVLAAKDFVGKGTAGEIWWEVDSINANTITLIVPYSGINGTVASKKLGIIDTGAAESYGVIQEVLASGTVGNRLKGSGGWNLNTETQDGETWFWQSGDSRYGYALKLNVKNYVELSGIGFLRYRYGVYVTACTDLRMVGVGIFGTEYCFWISGYGLGMENCTAAGATGRGIQLAGGSFNLVGTTLLSNARALFLYEASVYADGLVCKWTNTADYTIRADVLCNAHMQDVTLENNATDGITIPGGSEICIEESTSLSISITGIIGVGIPSAGMMGDDEQRPTVRIQHHGQTGINESYFAAGKIGRDTAEARSGACVKFTPLHATYYITQKFCVPVLVGQARTVKIYMKDDDAFNGDVQAALYFLGQKVTGWTEWTMTTEYVEQSIAAGADDITETGILELRIKVRGTAGNVYADDLSYD